MSNKFSKEYWDQHYKDVSQGGGTLQASPYLTMVSVDLPPGRALDAGCGKGDDAIWLTKHGWSVDAVDISASVIQQSQQRAKSNKVEVYFQQADLTSWLPKSNHYDLVTSHYVHTTDNSSFIKRLASAVKSDGMLIIVGHQPPTSHQVSHHTHGSYISAQEVASYFSDKEWEILEAGSHTSEKATPDGRIIALNDSVFIAKKK